MVILLSFLSLPRIHKIGRENLPILDSTRVCSDHFVNSKGRKLRPDEYPTLNLPSLPTQVSVPPPRRQLIRYSLPEKRKRCNEDETEREVLYSNVETNTELTWFAINEMENKLNEMTKQVEECRLECNSLKEKEHLRLNNIKDDNEKIKFYTGFSTIKLLMICFNFLGDISSILNYWGTSSAETKTSKGRKRALPPLEEFFLMLIRVI